ncbi:flagellar export chaperone FliS [Natroniella sulfidigena]|uniref:flagellar export chaperone FliS n=1 Tax=Natroniella sulfidigena TaxID=723921 RepID=UPI00200AB3C4|nr:flagellar export chaperone FliS [Natroniella sulfidigena]MCK8816024.1 flagellar export chaperone FliS [Natroniella sulfidigena]
MNYSNAQQQYKKNNVQTASPGKLLIMLYQGAIKFLNRTEVFMEKEDYEQVNNHLIRVQDIITELRCTLDKEVGGEFAENLDALYEYMYHLLVQANKDKDLEPIHQVKEYLKELLEAWQEANKKVGNKVFKQNNAAKLDITSE